MQHQQNRSKKRKNLKLLTAFIGASLCSGGASSHDFFSSKVESHLDAQLSSLSTTIENAYANDGHTGEKLDSLTKTALVNIERLMRDETNGIKSVQALSKLGGHEGFSEQEVINSFVEQCKADVAKCLQQTGSVSLDAKKQADQALKEAEKLLKYAQESQKRAQAEGLIKLFDERYLMWGLGKSNKAFQSMPKAARDVFVKRVCDDLVPLSVQVNYWTAVGNSKAAGKKTPKITFFNPLKQLDFNNDALLKDVENGLKQGYNGNSLLCSIEPRAKQVLADQGVGLFFAMNASLQKAMFGILFDVYSDVLEQKKTNKKVTEKTYVDQINQRIDRMIEVTKKPPSKPLKKVIT